MAEENYSFEMDGQDYSFVMDEHLSFIFNGIFRYLDNLNDAIRNNIYEDFENIMGTFIDTQFSKTSKGTIKGTMLASKFNDFSNLTYEKLVEKYYEKHENYNNLVNLKIQIKNTYEAFFDIYSISGEFNNKVVFEKSQNSVDKCLQNDFMDSFMDFKVFNGFKNNLSSAIDIYNGYIGELSECMYVMGIEVCAEDNDVDTKNEIALCNQAFEVIKELDKLSEIRSQGKVLLSSLSFLATFINSELYGKNKDERLVRKIGLGRNTIYQKYFGLENIPNNKNLDYFIKKTMAFNGSEVVNHKLFLHKDRIKLKPSLIVGN